MFTCGRDPPTYDTSPAVVWTKTRKGSNRPTVTPAYSPSRRQSCAPPHSRRPRKQTIINAM